MVLSPLPMLLRMPATLLTVLLWMAAALNCGTMLAEAEPASPPPAAIAMIGDSLTRQGDWRKLLRRDDVVNWGHPGYTTGQLEWTFKDLVRLQPRLKVVFLSGGTNDLLLGVPVERIYLNQVKAVKYWRERGVIVVLQAVTLKRGDAETNALIKGLNDRLREYCEAESVTYLDPNRQLSENDELRAELTTEGTHLTPQAYPLWAEQVVAALRTLGY